MLNKSTSLRSICKFYIPIRDGDGKWSFNRPVEDGVGTNHLFARNIAYIGDELQCIVCVELSRTQNKILLPEVPDFYLDFISPSVFTLL